MKAITLNEVINEQLKNKDFSVEYERELLINATAQVVVKLRLDKKLTQSQLAKKLGAKEFFHG